jgi:hypothetical protein
MPVNMAAPTQACRPQIFRCSEHPESNQIASCGVSGIELKMLFSGCLQMALTIDKVRVWRAYAAEIRLAAASYRSEAARQGVLAAARSYEELASTTERWLREFRPRKTN